MSDPVRLTGGAMTEDVLLIDGQVHRTAHPNSQYVAELLRVVADRGCAWAPRHLGRDQAGLDIFTYLPGCTGAEHELLSPDAYAQAAKILRQLHTITTGHPLARGQQCVVHGDCGPWNWVLRDGAVVGLIDWDGAGPGSRLSEFGYMAWTWCVTGYSHVTDDAELRLLRLLRDSYDPALTGGQVVDAILLAQQDAIVWAHTRLETPGLTAEQAEHARDSRQWAYRCRDRTLEREARFRAHLDLP